MYCVREDDLRTGFKPAREIGIRHIDPCACIERPPPDSGLSGLFVLKCEPR